MRRIYPFILVLTMLTFSFGGAVLAQEGLCPDTFATLYPGQIGRVTPGDPNNVRDAATINGNLLGQIPGDAMVNILAGPVCADGYYWYQVEYGDLLGWTVEGSGEEPFLVPAFDRVFRGYRSENEHITFGYSTTFADDVTTSLTPAGVSDADMIGAYPESLTLSFERWNQETGFYEDNGAFMTVINRDTVTEDMNVYGRIQQLETALSAEEPTATSPISIYPAIMVFAADVREITFRGGRGIAFYTAFSFDVHPLVASELRYVFSGLTDDGQYAVTFSTPVENNYLPGSIPTDFDFSAFEQNWEAYIDELTATIEADPDSTFPSRSMLDDMLSSLQLTPPLNSFTPGFSGDIAVSTNTLSMNVPGALGTRVEERFTQGYIDREGNSMYGSMPDEYRYNLFGYPVENMPYQQPRIHVFPVDTFDPGSVYAQELERFTAILAAQPESGGALVSNPRENGESVPFFPLFNAAQVMVVQPQVVNFENGRGIRFLTFYAQDIAVPVDGMMFYAFVGLTSDGSHLISATMPVNGEALPEEFDYMAIDYEEFSTNYQDIIAEIQATLDAEPATNFTPSLDLLDYMISTINVGAQ